MTESKPVEHGTQSVVLVDTPGFDDTLESDMVILARIAAYLERVSVPVHHSINVWNIAHLPFPLDIVRARNFTASSTCIESLTAE